MSFAWAILYFTFEAIPLLFGTAYGFSSQANGLVFISISVASIIAAVAAIWQDRIVTDQSSRFSRLFTHILPSTAVPNRPEQRLCFACFQSLLLPIGIFWLGTTVEPSAPWPVPVLAVGCLILGIFSVYLAVFNYLADTYQVYASSAIAAQSFTRNVFAACLPLVTEKMFGKLGFNEAGYLLGGVGLALSAVPWVLVVWGERIRARSKIAKQLAE